MKILFAGTTAQAARVLRHLAATRQVVAVLTREDAATGRKAELTASTVAEVATELGLPLIKANKVDEQIDQTLVATNFDTAVVVAYGTILKQRTLDLAANGWFNLHYSLLPKYRGAAPVQRAILNSETETGVSIFKLDAGMDSGLIIGQVPTVIEPGENSGDLLERLTSVGITLLDEVLPGIESGTAKFTEQVGEPSFAAKLDRQTARLDFSHAANELEALVRACNPEPMAWCELDSNPLRILSAKALNIDFEHPVGFVFSEQNKVFVACGKHALELELVQPAGKKPMAATDWFRGLRDETTLL